MSNDSGFPPPPPPPDYAASSTAQNPAAVPLDPAPAPFDSVSNFFDQPLAVGTQPASLGLRFSGAILEGILMIVTLGIGWIIWSVFAWQKGQTPAKSVMGLTVVHSRTGQTATFGQMVLREVVCKVLLASFTGGLTSFIGAALVLGPKRQALWDLVASTTVIKSR